MNEGDKITISTDEVFGTKDKISTTYKSLPNDVASGDQILLDDGLLEFKVLNVIDNNVECVVIIGGVLYSNKGLNLPNVHLSTPALTEKDIADLTFGLELEIDYVALSFVRKADDVKHVQKIMKEHKKELPVISKIEKPEAVKNIDQIIDVSYGIMVARGDLGVEVNVEKVPVIQKEIIKKCNAVGKPVIVATQMLDSMIKNPRPTRAESSDVANAVLDGTDAVMLSGETAAGKYPVKSVKTMDAIIQSVEDKFVQREIKLKSIDFYHVHSVSQAIAYSSLNVARTLDAKLIASITHTGNTARQIARYRPYLPIVAVTDDERVPRKMALIRGVRCLLIDRIEKTEECFVEIEERVENLGHLKEGDLIVFTAGMPTLEKNSTNMIKVHKVEKDISALF